MTTTGQTRRRRGGTTQIMPASESADTTSGTASIALAAYHLFLARGATHGHDLDDWLTAESQLLAGSGVKKRRTSSRRA
jgi:hypothetical protein